jgi:tetratricopeptide (TPR) repeat protein
LSFAVVLLPAAAFVIQASYLALRRPIGDYGPESDFYGSYASGAVRLQHGELDVSRYGVVGPAYEFVLALLGATGIDLFRAAQVISILAGAGALICLGWLVRSRLGSAAGLAAVLLAGTNAVWLRYSISATTDAIFLLLASLTLALAYASRPLLSGFSAGLAALTRYSGVVLLPALVLATFPPRPWSPWRGRRLPALLLLLVGGGALLVGWSVFAQSRGGAPELRFYHNIAYEVFARPEGITWDDYGENMEKEFPTLGSVIARDPGAVAAQVSGNIWRHVVGDIRLTFGWGLTACAVLGILLLGRRARVLFPLLCFGVLYYLSHATVGHSARYSLPLVLVAAAMAGGLAAWCWEAVRNVNRNQAVRALAGFALVAVVAVAAFQARASVLEALEREDELPRQALTLAEELESRLPEEARPLVMARKAHFPFSVGGRMVPFPDCHELGELGAAARESGAQFLFFSWPEAGLRPQFEFLMVAEFAPPGLTLAGRSADGLALLYEIDERLGQVVPEWYPEGRAWRNAEGRTRWRSQDLAALLAAAAGRMGEGYLDQADTLLRLARSVAPQDGDVQVGIGQLHSLRNQPQQAREIIEQALAAGYSKPGAWWLLAAAAYDLGDIPAAVSALETYCSLVEDPRALELLESLRQSVRRSQ